MPYPPSTLHIFSGVVTEMRAVRCRAMSGSFRKLFQIADIKDPNGTRKRCRSHMFRDTFAVELLLAGVPIDQVSVLLGHRSVKMTERHYLPWVKARQKQLTASVHRAWFSEVQQALVAR
jgi:integrase